MPYLYRFKGATAPLQMVLNNGTVPNSFVKFTCQALAVANTAAKGRQSYWVLPDTLDNIVTVSKPMKLYHPWAYGFLANTEQSFPISGGGAGSYGMLAGLVTFASSDLAPSFVFKREGTGNNFKIYLSDDENNLIGKPKLVIDKLNSSRVVITTSSITVSTNLDDVFTPQLIDPNPNTL